MTRPHDMGGRYGDGPVVPEPEEERFHADWHRRALAVTLASGAHGKWNIDVSRHARERLAPMDYARFSYYEKWMAALADLLATYAPDHPDHPMTEVMREGQQSIATPRRRGGWRARTRRASS